MNYINALSKVKKRLADGDDLSAWQILNMNMAAYHENLTRRAEHVISHYRWSDSWEHQMDEQEAFPYWIVFMDARQLTSKSKAADVLGILEDDFSKGCSSVYVFPGGGFLECLGLNGPYYTLVDREEYKSESMSEVAFRVFEFFWHNYPETIRLALEQVAN